MAIRISITVEEIDDNTDDQIGELEDYGFSIYNRAILRPRTDELKQFRTAVKELVETTFVRDHVSTIVPPTGGTLRGEINQIRAKLGRPPMPEVEDDGTIYIRTNKGGKAEIVERSTGKVIGAQG